jgi:hypothetical protein
MIFRNFGTVLVRESESGEKFVRHVYIDKGSSCHVAGSSCHVGTCNGQMISKLPTHVPRCKKTWHNHSFG